MGIASVLAVVLAGWLIGATGIGGVLVVPALTRLGDLAVSQAIAASALGFAFPGAAARGCCAASPPGPKAAAR